MFMLRLLLFWHRASFTHTHYLRGLFISVPLRVTNGAATSILSSEPFLPHGLSRDADTGTGDTAPTTPVADRLVHLERSSPPAHRLLLTVPPR